jgi:F0F1-type ATP synthase membrane subunit b/b'
VTAIVVVLAVLVLVLAAWLFGTRNALREARHRGDELTERLDAATRDVERTMGDLATAESNLADERKRVNAADEAAGAAAKEAEKSDAVARAASERVLALERETVDANGLWALEAVRFDRVWRDHAAVGPDAPSPLADTVDPARAAIEILAEALREDSGTAIEVQWKADQAAAPAPAARLVRACEEVLAVARAADEGVIEVHQEGSDTYVVKVRTEPPVSVPPHVVAALEAAGCEPSAHADGRVELHIGSGAEPETSV